MGYFTLPLARMVGPQGRVIAVEIQKKMLSVLDRRARKAGRGIFTQTHGSAYPEKGNEKCYRLAGRVRADA
jgi:ubiquinone/menaquinone biosynthesis C-methylase UbiE